MGSWEIPVNEEETIDVWVRDELSIWETKMKRIINDLKKYGKYVIYAGQSELKAEVANSYLNWLWWVIEPFCFMLVYAFVFGVIFDSQLQYFPIFIFIGITVWDFFNRMLKASVSSVKNSKAIVSKVYIPKYMLILVKGYVNGFKMLVSFAIVFGMILVWGVPITWKFLFIIPILLTLFVITFGVCTFLLHFGVYVDDLANVLNIFLRMMFYLTGIFYDLYAKVGAHFGNKVADWITELNPVAVMLASLRRVLLYGELPHYKWMIGWFLIGLVISWFGIRLIYKNENSYVKVI